MRVEITYSQYDRSPKDNRTRDNPTNREPLHQVTRGKLAGQIAKIEY